MAKEQNKQISYYFLYYTSTEKQISTLAKLLNKSKDSAHYTNKAFVNTIE